MPTGILPKPIFLAVFALVCSTPVISGAQTPGSLSELLQNGLKYEEITPTRGKIDLSGKWQFSTDGGKEWRPVVIPSTLEDNSSSVTFEKRVFIPKDFLDRNVFSLVLGNGGVSTEIRIDNEFVAIHSGAFSGINAKIPDRLLQAGTENIIDILCDNQLSPTTSIPLRQLAFQPKCFTGLFRDVYVEVKPPIYIDQPSVKVVLGQGGNNAAIESDIVVYASDYSRYGIDSTATTVTLKAHAELFDKALGKAVAKSAENDFELTQNHNAKIHLSMLVQSPRLWSPAQPNLYQLQFYIANANGTIDEYTEDIGFRSLSISGGKFVLNGEPVFVKSVNYVEDSPEFNAALDEVQLEKDIAVIKTLGANAVHVVSFPPSRALLDLCDRFGLLVFEDLPVSDAPPSVLESKQYVTSVQSYLRDLLQQTSYHPCIAAVSAGSNLDPTSPASQDYVNTLASIVHSESDKLVFYTPLVGMWDGMQTDADCVGLNLSSFDSARPLKGFLSQLASENPKTTFFVSSVGTQTQLDNHNGYSDPLSLEHQARYLVDAYEAIDNSGLAGISINSFADWQGAVPHLMPNGHPYLYSFGLVSYWREKRPSFAAVRALFNDETLPSLPIGNYGDTPPIIYVVLSTLLLVIVTYLHYSRRWFRESAARAVFRPYNFFADIRDQRMISAFQTTTVLFLVSAGISIYLSSLAYAFRESYVFDRILGLIIPSDFIKIKIDYLVWHPLDFIVASTVFFMVLVSLVTIVIKLFSFAVKIRLQLVSAFTVATWSMLPMTVLILIDMILFRLLGDRGLVWAAIVVLLILFILSLFRLFHGIGVIYDLPTIRVGAIGSLMVLLLVILVVLYYNGMNGLIPYAKFFYKFIVDSRVA